MPWGFRILFALNLAYCTMGVVSGRFPSWRMFERAEPLAEELRDRSGELIDLRAYVPRDAYLTDLDSVLAVATFICAAHPERGPFVMTESHHALRRESGDDCLFQP
jgi:hypothetical protein